MKKYTVTLHSKNDLDSFYEDMETPGGNLYIPDRQVETFSKRPSSRSTHYYLTEEEAQTLRDDPRVEYVVVDTSEIKGLQFRPKLFYTEENAQVARRPSNDTSYLNRENITTGTEITVSNAANAGLNGVIPYNAVQTDETNFTYLSNIKAVLTGRVFFNVSDWLPSTDTTKIRKFRVIDNLGNPKPWYDALSIYDDLNLLTEALNNWIDPDPINPITIQVEAKEWPNQANFDSDTNGTVIFLKSITIEYSESLVEDRQWGWVTCLTDENPAGFDVGGANEVLNFDISYPYTGKNVDIVIMDAVPITSPGSELTKIDDASTTRDQMYDWHQHSLAVEGISKPTFDFYQPKETSGSWHSNHVTSTAAGKYEGWAKDANVYRLCYDFNSHRTLYEDSYQQTNITDADWALSWDYIREWHNTKPVNPVTGRKNPTIVNNSWGLELFAPQGTRIKTINYRGTDYVPGNPDNQIGTGGFVLETLPAGWSSVSGNTDINLLTFNISQFPIPYHDIQISGSARVLVQSANIDFAFSLLSASSSITINNINIEIYDETMTLLETRPLSARIQDTDYQLVLENSFEYDVPEGLTYTLRINLDITLVGPVLAASACRLLIADSGVTQYFDSENGLYLTDAKIAGFTGDPVNIKQEIITSGVPSAVTNYLVSAPANFNVGQNFTNLSTNQNFTEAQTDNFSIVVERPCDYKQNHSIRIYTTNETDFVRVKISTSTGLSYIKGPYYGPVIDVNIDDIIQLSGTGQVTIFYSVIYDFEADPQVVDNIEQTWSVVTSDLNSLAVNNNVNQTENTDSVISLSDETIKLNKSQNLPTYNKSIIYADETATVNELVFLPITDTNGLTTRTDFDVEHPLVNGAQLYPHIGYWNLSLPFDIEYFGVTYNNLYVNSASSISFGGTSFDPRSSYFNPPFPKIFISAGNSTFGRSVQRIYYGTEGVAPNREFRIVYEGHVSAYNGVLGSPTLRWEARFFESTPAKIEIIIEQNESDYETGGAMLTPEEHRLYKYPDYSTGFMNKAVNTAIQDCINDGIIVVCASGNSSNIIAEENDADWNNYVVLSTDSVSSDLQEVTDGIYEFPNKLYYNRGQTPSSPKNGVILVGAGSMELDPETGLEKKTKFSTTGPGVSIFAPGNYVQGDFGVNSALDSRSRINPDGVQSEYRKVSGTSMSSPQVTGILACVLEKYPNMTQEEAIEFLKQTGFKSRMAENTDLVEMYSSNLGGGPNLYLRYPKLRPENDITYPRPNFKIRPSSGAVYPRTNVQKRNR